MGQQKVTGLQTEICDPLFSGADGHDLFSRDSLTNNKGVLNNMLN